MSRSVRIVRLAVLLVSISNCVFSQSEVVPLSEADIQELVDAHNLFRGMVDPPASNMQTLQWNEELAGVAQAYAEMCIFRDNPNRTGQAPSFPTVGENLSASNARTPNYTEFVESGWFMQRVNYNYQTNMCSSPGSCTDYVQLVWANTTELGCGVARCRTIDGFGLPNALLLVCNYAPEGRIEDGQPYVSGDFCSNCPEGFDCVENLCVAMQPATSPPPMTMTTMTTTITVTTQASTTTGTPPTTTRTQTTSQSTDPPTTTSTTREDITTILTTTTTPSIETTVTTEQDTTTELPSTTTQEPTATTTSTHATEVTTLGSTTAIKSPRTTQDPCTLYKKIIAILERRITDWSSRRKSGRSRSRDTDTTNMINSGVDTTVDRSPHTKKSRSRDTDTTNKPTSRSSEDTTVDQSPHTKKSRSRDTDTTNKPTSRSSEDTTVDQSSHTKKSGRSRSRDTDTTNMTTSRSSEDRSLSEDKTGKRKKKTRKPKLAKKHRKHGRRAKARKKKAKRKG